MKRQPSLTLLTIMPLSSLNHSEYIFPRNKFSLFIYQRYLFFIFHHSLFTLPNLTSNYVFFSRLPIPLKLHTFNIKLRLEYIFMLLQNGNNENFSCLNWFDFHQYCSDVLVLTLAHMEFSHSRFLNNSSSELCLNNNRCYSGHNFFSMGTGRVCIIII